MAAAKTPQGLRTSGRRLWRACQEAYDFDVHEELLLLQACRTADRLDVLTAEADANPPTVVNARGDQVPHPAVTESRQQALTLARLLASLRLPAGERRHDDPSATPRRCPRPVRRPWSRVVRRRAAGIVWPPLLDVCDPADWQRADALTDDPAWRT